MPGGGLPGDGLPGGRQVQQLVDKPPKEFRFLWRRLFLPGGALPGGALPGGVTLYRCRKT